MINKVLLEGRLGNDPIQYRTKNGKTVTKISLPLFDLFNKETKNAGWIQCDVWNSKGDFLFNNTGKGDLVSVEGRLKSDKYKDNEGNTKYRTFVNADFVTVLNNSKSKNRNNSENHHQNNNDLPFFPDDQQPVEEFSPPPPDDEDAPPPKKDHEMISEPTIPETSGAQSESLFGSKDIDDRFKSLLDS